MIGATCTGRLLQRAGNTWSEFVEISCCSIGVALSSLPAPDPPSATFKISTVSAVEFAITPRSLHLFHGLNSSQPPRGPGFGSFVLSDFFDLNAERTFKLRALIGLPVAQPSAMASIATGMGHTACPHLLACPIMPCPALPCPAYTFSLYMSFLLACAVDF